MLYTKQNAKPIIRDLLLPARQFMELLIHIYILNLHNKYITWRRRRLWCPLINGNFEKRHPHKARRFKASNDPMSVYFESDCQSKTVNVCFWHTNSPIMLCLCVSKFVESGPFCCSRVISSCSSNNFPNETLILQLVHYYKLVIMNN